jgi:predicted lipid-binding transport protein (Tim44 family)
LFFPIETIARPGGGHSFGGGGGGYSGGGGSYGGGYSSSGGSSGPMTATDRKVLLILVVSFFVIPFAFSFVGTSMNRIGRGEHKALHYVKILAMFALGVILIWFDQVTWLFVYYSILFLIGLTGFIKGRNHMKKPIPIYKESPVRRLEASQKVQNQIQSIIDDDPAFSRVIFMDFIHLLYHRLYQAKASGDFSMVKPFIYKDEFERILIERETTSYSTAYLGKDKDNTIEEVVIGNINILYAEVLKNTHFFKVEITANFTVVEGNYRSRWMASEVWNLGRKREVKTKLPNRVSELECPACGAPADFTDAGECKNCKTLLNANHIPWFLFERPSVKLDFIASSSLTHYAKEVGTNDPSMIQPDINEKMRAFCQKHEIQDCNLYFNNLKTKLIESAFYDIYSAWSSLKWENVRHLITDRLWESNNFWIEFYRKNDLNNRLDNTKIQFVDIAKIEMDNFYEAITARVFATCNDYVVKSGTENVVGGDKYARRAFSEYWTFIRRTGVEKGLDTFDKTKCPNCGAPADKMGQNAICEYCDTKITTGEFGWVLAAIIQDEIYRG